MSIVHPEPTFVIKYIFYSPSESMALPRSLHALTLVYLRGLSLSGGIRHGNTARGVLGHSSCHGEVWHALSRVTCHAGAVLTLVTTSHPGIVCFMRWMTLSFLTSPILFLEGKSKGMFLRIVVTVVATRHSMAAGTRRGQQRAGGTGPIGLPDTQYTG